MKPRVVVLVAMISGVALAGCLVDDEPTTEAVPFERPDHSPGQSWTYSMDGDLGTAESTPGVPTDAGEGFTMVRGPGDEDAPIFETDSCEIEFQKSGLPLLGTKPLGGDQGFLNLLDWPLEEGKTWTTGSENFPYEVTVEKIEGDVAHIVVVNQDDETRIKARYDASIGWFTELRDATRELTFRLQDTGTDYAGDVCTQTETSLLDYELQDGVHEESIEAPGQGTLQITGELSAEATLAGAWVARLEYKRPDSSSYEVYYEHQYHCIAATCEGTGSVIKYVTSEGGDWQWRFTTLTYTGTLELNHIDFRMDPFTP